MSTACYGTLQPSTAIEHVQTQGEGLKNLSLKACYSCRRHAEAGFLRPSLAFAVRTCSIAVDRRNAHVTYVTELL